MMAVGVIAVCIRIGILQVLNVFRSRRKWILVLLGLVSLLVILDILWVQHKCLIWCDGGVLATSSFSPYNFNQNWTCVDRMAQEHGRVEDIFCIVLPKFLPAVKNPCFFDYNINGTKCIHCLPYFYIIGMDKSGSTDLHSRISQHPLVLNNSGFLQKETGFWSWSRYGIHNQQLTQKNATLAEYLDMFSQMANKTQNTTNASFITGDATPMDFWDFRFWPLIPQNFDKKEPEVLTPHLIKYIHRDRPPKFLIQFREPIERLYSDYIFLEYGKTPQEFHNHSLQAIDMMTTCLRNSSRRFCYFSRKLYSDLPVRIHLGCYSVFLREWLRVFPRNFFLITTMDEYQRDMKNMLIKVFKFLDLSPLPESTISKIVNQNRLRVTTQKSGNVLPETVKLLRHFYDGCNREMADMLSDSRFLWHDHYL